MNKGINKNMNRDKQFWKKINTAIFLGLILLALVLWQLPDKKLHLVVCDVGQGDAILVSWQSYQMLVDGGPDQSVLSCLSEKMPFWDRNLEVVVLTHPDSDHVTGLIEVLKRYRVDNLIAGDVAKDSAEFWEFHGLVMDKGIKVRSLHQGDNLRIGPVKLNVLWPESSTQQLVWKKDRTDLQVLGAQVFPKDINETSLVLLANYGDFDFLLAGDIGEKTERHLLKKEGLNQVEVLKVAHHGSKFSSSQDFLNLVSPEMAVISVGKNWFGHPTREVLEKLEQIKVKIIRTDQQGTVEIVSDGRDWWQK